MGYGYHDKARPLDDDENKFCVPCLLPKIHSYEFMTIKITFILENNFISNMADH